MPYFPNPNGGAPIQAATNPNPAGGSYGYYSDPGYNGPPPGTPGAGAAGGGTGGTAYAASDPYGGGLAAFGAATSGVTQAQLAQQKAEFDAQLQFAKDQMTQLGIPQLQINQYLAQLQQQQFQAQLQLAQQSQMYQQAANTAQLTGWYQAPQGVPSVSQYLQASSPVGTQGGQGGGGQQAGGQAGAGQGAVAPGSFLHDPSNNQTGVVMADGTVHIFNGWDDAKTYGYTPGMNATTVAPGGIAHINAQAQSGTGPNTGPVQTLAGQQQQANLSGMYQGAPTEQAREFNANLGQQYLATASQLTGPQNTFQLSNYMRGAQGNQAVPTYLQSLINGAAPPAFQGAGSTRPTVQSAQGLMGQMGGGLYGAGVGGNQTPSTGQPGFTPQQQGTYDQGGWLMPGQTVAQNNTGQPEQVIGPQNQPSMSDNVWNPQTGGMQAPTNWGTPPDLSQTGQPTSGAFRTSATPGWDYNQTLGAMRNIMQRGAQSLAPGSLERLNPDELAAFGSGLGAVGGSLPSFLSQYQQSRIGQQAPTQQLQLA